MRPTYLTIDTSLVRENLRKIKDSLPEWSTSTAVIKANGYGHGSVMMGRIAVEEAPAAEDCEGPRVPGSHITRDRTGNHTGVRFHPGDDLGAERSTG